LSLSYSSHKGRPWGKGGVKVTLSFWETGFPVVTHSRQPLIPGQFRRLWAKEVAAWTQSCRDPVTWTYYGSGKAHLNHFPFKGDHFCYHHKISSVLHQSPTFLQITFTCKPSYLRGRDRKISVPHQSRQKVIKTLA
jgi:coproporphyrinogen III oxidase